MKAGEWSDEQIHTCVNEIVDLLQEAQKGEKSIVALCKDKGITETTFYEVTQA